MDEEASRYNIDELVDNLDSDDDDEDDEGEGAEESGPGQFSTPSDESRAKQFFELRRQFLSQEQLNTARAMDKEIGKREGDYNHEDHHKHEDGNDSAATSSQFGRLVFSVGGLGTIEKREKERSPP